MRSSISSMDAPSRVQRLISSRMAGMRDTSWVGTESAPRSCPLPVPDYGELHTVARLESRPPAGEGESGQGRKPTDRRAEDRARTLFVRSNSD
jgi:hypothetical protein